MPHHSCNPEKRPMDVGMGIAELQKVLLVQIQYQRSNVLPMHEGVGL